MSEHRKIIITIFHSIYFVAINKIFLHELEVFEWFMVAKKSHTEQDTITKGFTKQNNRRLGTRKVPKASMRRDDYDDGAGKEHVRTERVILIVLFSESM